MNGTERLVAHLKRQPHTYMQMLNYCVSTSPWRRVEEWLSRNPKWVLRKGKLWRGGREYLTTWRIVRAR